MGPKKNANVRAGGEAAERERERERVRQQEKSGEKVGKANISEPAKTRGEKANSFFVWSVSIVKLSCKPKRIRIMPDNSEIGALHITNKPYEPKKGFLNYTERSGSVGRSPFFFFFRNRLWMLTVLFALFPPTLQ